MSECVVRMEMPKNCYACDIRFSEHIKDCPIEDWGKEGMAKYCSCRHPDCPIHTVLPEKHGRLVFTTDEGEEYAYDC